MYPRTFRYLAPKTLNEAVEFALSHPEEAKYLAGGQSLIPMMKLRIASPAYVIDVNRINGLSYIKVSDSMLSIGALARHSDIEHSDIVEKNMPILKEAAAQIADQQVRNLGTMAGSISHADPAADWPAVALACRAEFSIIGKNERAVKADDFFQGPFQTAMEPGEFLREIKIPLPEGRYGYSYMKFERKAGDFATVGVAVMLRLNGNVIDDAAIALTAVAPKQFRLYDAEKLLTGKEPSNELIEEASKIAAEKSEPSADLRGSVEYKREMARIFTKRAIKAALARAGWVGN